MARLLRTRLLDGPAIRAERVRCEGLSRDPTPELDEPETQVVLTLDGAFLYHVGRREAFIDANRVAFVRAGETSRDSHPTRSDVTCLVLTPSPELLDGRRVGMTALAPPELQLAAARFVAAPMDPLAAEEEAIRLAHAAIARASGEPGPRPAAAVRLARRAKALLPPAGRPIGLTALARQLAVSPAYLTEAFRLAEGLPIVRYQLRLRLARALAELPRAGDLAALALDLGFSSHSHFTTAFRRALGLTPSQYRRSVGARAIRRS